MKSIMRKIRILKLRLCRKLWGIIGINYTKLISYARNVEEAYYFYNKAMYALKNERTCLKHIQKLEKGA